MSNASMPKGVTIAGLGERALVAVLDALPVAVVSGLLWLVAGRAGATVLLVLVIAAAVLDLVWLVFLWWRYATRGQSPAAQWLRVRVLRLADGRPLGWGRFFLRQLVWFATMVLPVVWLVLVVMMVLHPRRRGWHDLAGQSVVVRANPPAVQADAPVQRPAVASANMVGLPPHLTQSLPVPPALRPSQIGDEEPAGPITSLPEFAAQAAFAPEPTIPWGQWGAALPTTPAPQPYPSQQPPAFPQHPSQQPYAPQQQNPYATPPQPYPPQQQYPQQQYPPQQYPPQQPYSPGQPSYSPASGPYQPSPQPGQFGVQAQSRPTPAPVEVDDETRTHLAPAAGSAPRRGATDGWQLRLDDGRTVPVRGLVLIGRNPAAQDGEAAELVQAGTESRMVSKTHLAVGLDHRGPYVMDRGSTNGTAIANAGGQFEPCAPGDPVRVREGQIVSFGDRYLEVRRDPA